MRLRVKVRGIRGYSCLLPCVLVCVYACEGKETGSRCLPPVWKASSEDQRRSELQGRLSKTEELHSVRTEG